MIKENRILAYEKATELKNSDLIAISGGSATGTLIIDAVQTGYYPLPTDVMVAQMPDF